ncbi:MAG: NAD(P)-dependent dehydrogenase (short-subunit alcohol dehydrogenase family) [Gammaproteobacteria bacterium]|jgi:NAD(P)-dependent dehydrogenase (short-subunit alcohol dehydrogenase family)
MNRLAGKIAIITGAGSGQGRAAAALFAAQGAQVVIADIDEPGGRETLRSVTEAGGNGTFVRCDVADRASTEALVKQAVTTYGALHILYNNAAIWSGGKLDNFVTDLEEDNWETIINVNLKSVYLCCKYAIPAIIESGGGSVINAASAAGLIGSRGKSHAYSASKGGVISLTRAMAMAYAPHQVRINAICPGGVDTPMVSSMTNTDARAERFAASHPLGRMGQPADIAYCALYLASDEAAWVTGAIFPVDGGYTAQ